MVIAMRRQLVAACVAAVMAVKARDVKAQTWAQTYLPDRQVWLQDRAFLEGRGIRAGNFELHPGIGAEFGYDSNVFYSSSRSGTVTPALRLRVTPSFSVSTLGAQRTANSDSQATALPTVNFRAGVAAIYHEWIGLGDSQVDKLRNLGGQLDLRLDLFPQRTWQFSIANNFTRFIQPGPEDPATHAPAVVRRADGTTETVTLNRNYNVTAAELAYAPGRGVFELRAGYSFVVSIFDQAANERYDYLGHEGSVRMRWRFLPKTALIWEGFVNRIGYLNTTAGLSDSTPIRTRFGLNGLLTNKISLLVAVGYQGTFFDQGSNADTVIGQAELRWLINALSSLRVGFVRDVQNSFFGNYFVRNRGYAGYSQTFDGRFLLSVDAGVGLYQYGLISSTPDPTAVRVEGTVFGEYRFSNVFGVNATVRGAANISDVQIGTQYIDWTRFDALVGVRAFW